MSNIITMGPPKDKPETQVPSHAKAPKDLKTTRSKNFREAKEKGETSIAVHRKKKPDGIPMELSDCSLLIDMLGFMRPSREQNSIPYKMFLETYIEPVFGDHDGFYNYVLIIPDAPMNNDGTLPDITSENMPRVSYMAHHDTVHRDAGFQSNRLVYFNETDKVSNNENCILGVENPTPPMKEIDVVEKKWCMETKQMVSKDVKKMVPDHLAIKGEDESSCLGADCTTGIFIMLRMIEAGIAGVYVIHNDEEIGCVGSQHIVDDYDTAVMLADELNSKSLSNSEEETSYDSLSIEQQMVMNPFSFWIHHVDIAISFDRFGTSSIITHQSSTRTASDDFAHDLSDVLSEHLFNSGYYMLEPDDGGSFTDSNKYRKHIAECTNLSVGYLHQHSENETQDLTYVWYLTEALIASGSKINDAGTVGAYRDKSIEERKSYGGYGGYNNSNWLKDPFVERGVQSSHSSQTDKQNKASDELRLLEYEHDNGLEFSDQEREWMLAWGADPDDINDRLLRQQMHDDDWSDYYAELEEDRERDLKTKILDAYETSFNEEKVERFNKLCGEIESDPHIIAAIIVDKNVDERLLFELDELITQAKKSESDLAAFNDRF